MTLPNKITIVRICLIPVFVMFALYYGRSVAHGTPEEWLRWTAVAVFGVAAASDGLDGYIARRFHQMSRLGVVLDPIADKGLLLAGIITLSVSQWQYEFPIWFPVLIISRDVMVVAGAILMQFVIGQLRVKPSWLGKVATVAQMVAIGAVMLWPHAAWQWSFFGWHVRVLDVFAAVAVFFTVVSGLGYGRACLQELHSQGHGDARRPDEL